MFLQEDKTSSVSFINSFKIALVVYLVGTELINL